MKKLLAGLTILIPIAVLWVSAWAIHSFMPNDWSQEWYGFPMIATLFILTVCSLLAAVIANADAW